VRNTGNKVPHNTVSCFKVTYAIMMHMYHISIIGQARYWVFEIIFIHTSSKWWR